MIIITVTMIRIIIEYFMSALAKTISQSIVVLLQALTLTTIVHFCLPYWSLVSPHGLWTYRRNLYPGVKLAP